ncbi:ABC-2 family transporter protein [Nakamurella panacisegetis]|uniref:ABC-2 family transporter protein n=1 Tax=Nakamurella panacisegetis TaxID=1090615 RepID=A0A1H0RY46_9ACTN|nr:ABC transporter permease [Nakamurella panacisegetis]SDP34305.1 ABC-2 family transporter protein [Nakamurella panacisegetis]
MSTVTTAPDATRAPSTAEKSELAVTFPRVVRSEWIKLRSVRSIVITLLASAVVMIGIGVLAASVKAGNLTTAGTNRPGGGSGLGSDSTGISLAGVQLAQLIVAIVGVLLVTSEYSTGSIRGTLAAVPKRWPVLAAKVAVFGGVTFIVELVAVFIAFFAGQAILGSKGVSLGDAGVLQAVIGAAVYLTGTGLLGVALGFLLRSTASGIAVAVAAFFLLPGILGLFSTRIQDDIRPYLPSSAGTSLTSVTHSVQYLNYWPALLLLVAYVVVLGGAALLRMIRSDAN